MKTIRDCVKHYIKRIYYRQTAFSLCVLVLFLFAMAIFNTHLHIMRHNGDDLSRMGYFGFLQNSKLTVINMTELILQRKGFSLTTIPWESRTSVSKSPLQRHHLFKPIISTKEHAKLLEIFRVFRAICDWSNLTYLLYGGSLLGSYRHHGLIPWDDDIDVLMNESEKSQIYKYFTNISGYALCTPRNRQWKLYQMDNKSRKSCSENVWPYVDIFFFSENDTHIWDNNEMYQFVYNFAKEDIFPLTRSVFEGELAMSPKNTYTVLQRSYDVDLCTNTLYSHKNESVRDGKVVSLPCKRLLPYFAFVFRSCVSDLSCEYLVDKTVVVYKIITDHKCHDNMS